MKSKKSIRKTLSFVLALSLLVPAFSSIGVYAATKKTSFSSVKVTSATEVTLKWKKISSVSGYEIYQKKSGESYKRIKIISSKSTVSYKVSKLKSATKYTYKIRSYKTVKKSKQYSSYSAAKSVTTLPATPVITSAVEKNGEVSVQLRKVSGAKGYVVYKKTGSSNTKLITSTSISAKIKAKAGDEITARAYITVDKKNIYSAYSKSLKVVATQEEKPEDSPAVNPEVPAENGKNYVTEEYLQQSIDELKNLLENSYVTDEKAQQYIEEVKKLFADSYVTKEQLDEYFNNIKDTITDGYVTEEELQKYLEEIKGTTSSTGSYGFVDITDSIAIENCYYAYWSGEKIPFNNAQACYLSVLPGDKFKVSGFSVFDVALALFYDKDGKIIENKNYLNADGKKYNNETIVIPQDCYYVAFASHITGLPHNIMLNVMKYMRSDEVDSNIVNSKLYGKKMYANGDSVTEGAEKYSYVNFLTDKFVMSTNNEAKSGTTLAVREGYSDSICERILAMDTSKKYDYILIEGGFNDLLLSVEIGEITNPHNFGGYYDRTTVIGAMETICHHLVNNYYDTKKLFVLGHKCFGFWDSQIEYWDAIKSVLEKWGIPYVDLRTETNLCKRTEIDPIADKYFVNGDGIHPTKEAYEIFYVPLIRAKLEDL